jgi:pyridoxamine 5'-phosphate oxidase
MSISHVRTDYSKAELTEEQAGEDPLILFRNWLDFAEQSQLPEFNAMTLATVSATGQPSARIVLLRGFDERGLTFFTNYHSRKGQEIANNPRAALVFFWPQLERQIRIEGTLTFTSVEESDQYYHSRPIKSRLGAWVSQQSLPIPNREVLEQGLREIEEKYGENPPRPPYWGGYRLQPLHWEFWQGRRSRLHDRIVFDWIDSKWVRSRLAP